MRSEAAVRAAAEALYELENIGRSAVPFGELSAVEGLTRIEFTRVALEVADAATRPVDEVKSIREHLLIAAGAFAVCVPLILLAGWLIP